MITRLDGTLRREISIDGAPYVLVLTAEGFTLTEKGRRKGLSLRWEALVSGEVALATALQASLAQAPAARRSVPDAAASKRTGKTPPAASRPARRSRGSSR